MLTCYIVVFFLGTFNVDTKFSIVEPYDLMKVISLRKD